MVVSSLQSSLFFQAIYFLKILFSSISVSVDLLNFKNSKQKDFSYCLYLLFRIYRFVISRFIGLLTDTNDFFYSSSMYTQYKANSGQNSKPKFSSNYCNYKQSFWMVSKIFSWNLISFEKLSNFSYKDQLSSRIYAAFGCFGWMQDIILYKFGDDELIQQYKVIQGQELISIHVSVIIFSTYWMADEDFQMILSNTDYKRLQQYEIENKKLSGQKLKMVKQIAQLKNHVTDLKRAIYVRDSFIEHISNECDNTFASFLQLDIISADLSQSYYQNIISHQQNGISSIQLSEALDIFKKSNKGIFQRFAQITCKFMQYQSRIKALEQTQSEQEEKRKQRQHRIQKEKQVRRQIIEQKQSTTKDEQIKKLKEKIRAMEKQHSLEQEQLKSKLRKAQKQNQVINRKSDYEGEKSYVIKLMIDEYYNEIEKNLQKLGGLNKIEIGTLISNEMKGILQYIENLIKKAVK